MKKKRIKDYLFGLTLIFILYSVITLLYIYPYKPVGLIGWSILLFVGIPISLFFEMIAERFFNEKMSGNISKEKFSLKRIGYSLLFFFIAAGISVALWIIFGSFLGRYFK